MESPRPLTTDTVANNSGDRLGAAWLAWHTMKREFLGTTSIASRRVALASVSLAPLSNSDEPQCFSKPDATF